MNVRTSFFYSLVSLFVVGTFFAGCGTRQNQFVFETQPRLALPAGNFASTRSPRISVSPAGGVSLLAIYSEAGVQRVGFTMSHDGGDHFMPLRPISDEGVSISAHGENNPVMITTGRAVYALWEQSAADAARAIVLARSLNEGMTFEKPVRVNDNASPSFHGFASMAADSKGNAYVVWLDGREAPESPGTFDVYIAHSSDRGATFSPNIRVARSACPCCRPALALEKTAKSSSSGARYFPDPFGTWSFPFPKIPDSRFRNRHAFQKTDGKSKVAPNRAPLLRFRKVSFM
jgi:hypothetical protein